MSLLAAPTGTPLAHPLFTPTTSGFYPNYGSLAGFLAANPGWTVPTVTSGAVAAQFAVGGPGLFFDGNTRTINGIAPGAAAEYMLIGWTGNDLTFDAALQDYASFLGSRLSPRRQRVILPSSCLQGSRSASRPLSLA